MTTKKHIAFAVLFIVANIAVGVLAHGAHATHAEDSGTSGRALAEERYEHATAEELAMAYADSPIVCMAADTASGCR